MKTSGITSVILYTEKRITGGLKEQKNKSIDTLFWFITSDLQAKKYVGLRPSKKVKVFNGKLECDFLQYEMYEGSKKTKNQN